MRDVTVGPWRHGGLISAPGAPGPEGGISLRLCQHHRAERTCPVGTLLPAAACGGRGCSLVSSPGPGGHVHPPGAGRRRPGSRVFAPVPASGSGLPPSELARRGPRCSPGARPQERLCSPAEIRPTFPCSDGCRARAPSFPAGSSLRLLCTRGGGRSAFGVTQSQTRGGGPRGTPLL